MNATLYYIFKIFPTSVSSTLCLSIECLLLLLFSQCIAIIHIFFPSTLLLALMKDVSNMNMGESDNTEFNWNCTNKNKTRHSHSDIWAARLADKAMSPSREHCFWSWDLSVQSHGTLHIWVGDLGSSTGHSGYELYLLPLWYWCLFRVALSLSESRPWITLNVGEI